MMAGRELADVLNSLAYHRPDDHRVLDAMGRLRSASADLATIIAIAVPAGREQALAYTHLEEALMWGLKGLALHGPGPGFDTKMEDR